MTLQQFIVKYLPWLLSCITIYMTLLAGNKHPKAWAFGLGNQILWAVWICLSENWGLAPMCAALTFLYLRNHFKWNEIKLPWVQKLPSLRSRLRFRWPWSA